MSAPAASASKIGSKTSFIQACTTRSQLLGRLQQDWGSGSRSKNSGQILSHGSIADLSARRSGKRRSAIVLWRWVRSRCYQESRPGCIASGAGCRWAWLAAGYPSVCGCFVPHGEEVDARAVVCARGSVPSGGRSAAGAAGVEAGCAAGVELHGIAMRPARNPARKQELMSAEALQRVYVDEGRNLDEVAAFFGVSASTVKVRMRRLGIDRRKGPWCRVGDREPMTHDVLHELAVVQRLPATEIAAMLGYSAHQVRSALARHGVVRTAAARSSQRCLVSLLGPGELWWLHHHEQLTIADLARGLRTTWLTVRDRLAEVGVEIRPPSRPVIPPARPLTVPVPDLALIERVFADAAGRSPRRRRRGGGGLDLLSAEDACHLHHTQGLSLTEIGRRYRTSPWLVRARLGELGVEVRHRRGKRGSAKLTPNAKRRLASLYARADVAEALDRLGLGQRTTEESFDPPVDLTRNVLDALYSRLGLSSADVALLTDRSTGAVSRRGLRHVGIEVRHSLPQPVRRARGRVDVRVITRVSPATAGAQRISRKRSGFPAPPRCVSSRRSSRCRWRGRRTAHRCRPEWHAPCASPVWTRPTPRRCSTIGIEALAQGTACRRGPGHRTLLLSATCM